MKSKLALESQTTSGLYDQPSDSRNQADRFIAIHQAVASRAFELFEERGHRHGQDLADWLHAESEILLPIAVKTYDYEDTLIIRAKVPVLTADELEVTIEPRRVIISDKFVRESSKRILHTVFLPDRLDWQDAAIAFKDETLEVEIPKVLASDALTLD